MNKPQEEIKQPTATFTNCKNYGQQIDALFLLLANDIVIADFILEQTQKKIADYKTKLEEAKLSLLTRSQ